MINVKYTINVPTIFYKYGTFLGFVEAGLANRTLGPVHANNVLANTPFRSAGKECVAPLGRSKQATRDAARRPERGVPLLLKID